MFIRLRICSRFKNVTPWLIRCLPCEITMYYVYVLFDQRDRRFYVGDTRDLRRRL